MKMRRPPNRLVTRRLTEVPGGSGESWTFAHRTVGAPLRIGPDDGSTGRPT